MSALLKSEVEGQVTTACVKGVSETEVNKHLIFCMNVYDSVDLSFDSVVLGEESLCQL